MFWQIDHSWDRQRRCSARLIRTEPWTIFGLFGTLGAAAASQILTPWWWLVVGIALGAFAAWGFDIVIRPSTSAAFQVDVRLLRLPIRRHVAAAWTSTLDGDDDAPAAGYVTFDHKWSIEVQDVSMVAGVLRELSR